MCIIILEATWERYFLFCQRAISFEKRRKMEKTLGNSIILLFIKKIKGICVALSKSSIRIKIG
jgi:hypothetical protein